MGIKFFLLKVRRIRKPPYFCRPILQCLGGGIGRRAGFKIQFLRECGFDSRPRYKQQRCSACAAENLKNPSRAYSRWVFWFRYLLLLCLVEVYIFDPKYCRPMKKVEALPNMIPATFIGKPVRIQYTIPINAGLK